MSNKLNRKEEAIEKQMSNQKEKSRYQGEETDIGMSQLKEEILKKRKHRVSFTNLIIITMIEIREVAIVEAEAAEAVEVAITIIITTTIITEISITVTMEKTIMISITIEPTTTAQNMMINHRERIIITFQITLQIESLEETDIKKKMKRATLGDTKITTTTSITITTIIETTIETIKINRKLLQSNQKSREKFKKQKKQLRVKLL